VPHCGFWIIVGDGDGFRCGPDERVLLAMERQGRTDIPVGCRGGGCGICRVQVVQGRYRTGPMSRRHVTAEDAGNGYALACRLYAQDDLVLLRSPASPAGAGRVTTSPGPTKGDHSWR
jgi:ferredoxin